MSEVEHVKVVEKEVKFMLKRLDEIVSLSVNESCEIAHREIDLLVSELVDRKNARLVNH